MQRWYPFGIAGVALGVFLLPGCACPASYRDVPAPTVRSVADVQNLSDCQIKHYGTGLLAQASSATMAKALLEHGASVHGRIIINGKEQAGNPLNLASTPEVIRVLAAAGCNPNEQGGKDNSTPLCRALRRGQYDIASFLLTAGADPNLADSQGAPPLYIAAKQGNAHMCELLLRCGARPNATHKENGATPLLALLKSGNGVESNTETKQNIAQMLLSAGAAPLQPDADGTMPLHFAPACLVPTLLSAGADANCRDSAGRTPIFYGGSQQRLELLLQGGADLSVRDYAGNSAFDTVPEAALKSYLLVRGCRSGKAL